MRKKRIEGEREGGIEGEGREEWRKEEAIIRGRNIVHHIFVIPASYPLSTYTVYVL